MADQNSIYCCNCRQKTALTKRTEYQQSSLTKYEISECNNCNFFFLVERHFKVKSYGFILSHYQSPSIQEPQIFLKKI